jgi:ribosome-binding protein aMBF1 (putative translation factor)
MLITGGLIVLGVLILVAAFFIGRGDSASQANRTVPTPTTSAVTPEQVPTAPTVPVATPQPAQAAQTLETQPVLMNGQIHELASQLQKLQEQSQELARRLELLNTMVRRIEEGEATVADK